MGKWRIGFGSFDAPKKWWRTCLQYVETKNAFSSSDQHHIHCLLARLVKIRSQKSDPNAGIRFLGAGLHQISQQKLYMWPASAYRAIFRQYTLQLSSPPILKSVEASKPYAPSCHKGSHQVDFTFSLWKDTLTRGMHTPRMLRIASKLVQTDFRLSFLISRTRIGIY